MRQWTGLWVGSQETWFLIPSLSLPGCVAEGKSLHFSELQFPYMQNRDDNSLLKEVERIK